MRTFIVATIAISLVAALHEQVRGSLDPPVYLPSVNESDLDISPEQSMPADSSVSTPLSTTSPSSLALQVQRDVARAIQHRAYLRQFDPSLTPTSTPTPTQMYPGEETMNAEEAKPQAPPLFGTEGPTLENDDGYNNDNNDNNSDNIPSDEDITKFVTAYDASHGIHDDFSALDNPDAKFTYSASANNKAANDPKALIIGLVVGVGGGFLVLAGGLLAFFFLCRNRSSTSNSAGSAPPALTVVTPPTPAKSKAFSSSLYVHQRV